MSLSPDTHNTHTNVTNTFSLREAEDYAEEDKKVRERVDAKNSFDSYLHSMKQSVEDKDKLANKLDEDQKQQILDAVGTTPQSLPPSHPQAPSLSLCVCVCVCVFVS